MWGGDEETVFRNVLRAYDPTIENLPSVADDKTIRALVAGAPPDLFTLKDPSALGALAANQALQPLDELFVAAGLKDADFTPGALSQCRFRGKLYAIPYLLDCMVLLYNKRLIKEPPRTLEELEELCKRLTKRDSSGRITQIGLRPPEAVQLLGAAGAQFWDEKPERLTADHPNNSDGLRWYKRLMDAQGGNEAVEAFSAGFAEDMGSSNPFFKGLAAMEFSGQWNANYRVARGKSLLPAPRGQAHRRRLRVSDVEPDRGWAAQICGDNARGSQPAGDLASAYATNRRSVARALCAIFGSGQQPPRLPLPRPSRRRALPK
jgi:ABC-type glycerol-3-phosphate transport system substrate-binding protein